MVIRFIPNDTTRSQQKFDFAGAGVMFVFMASLLFALSVSQHSGFNNPLVFALLALAIGSLIAFIVIEKKSPYPMIDLKMFRNRQFSINLITGFMIFLCTAGTALLFPLYLQNILHYNSQQTGLMLAVTPICVSIIAPLSGALSDRTGSRPITTLGLLIVIIGFIAVSTLSETTSTWGYLLRFIPVGIGIGLFRSPNNSAVMGSVTREHLGVASGLLSFNAYGWSNSRHRHPERLLGKSRGFFITAASLNPVPPSHLLPTRWQVWWIQSTSLSRSWCWRFLSLSGRWWNSSNSKSPTPIHPFNRFQIQNRWLQTCNPNMGELTMHLLARFIQGFIPIGLIAGIGLASFSAFGQADQSRIKGFGVDLAERMPTNSEISESVLINIRKLRRVLRED